MVNYLSRPDVYEQQVLVVISSCGGGDWPPVLALAIGLGQRGHQVVMVCDEATAPAVRIAGLRSVVLPESLNLGRYFHPVLENLFKEQHPLTSTTPNPLQSWARDIEGFVIKELGSWRPSFILSSLLSCHGGERLATALNAPCCYFNPAYYFGSGGELFRKEDFSSLGALMYEKWLLPPLDSASLVLHGTDPQFDRMVATLPSCHHYTGPMFWEMPRMVPDWYKKSGTSWIIVSLSTSPQIDDLEMVKASLEAFTRRSLKQRSVRVLVTLPNHDAADRESLRQYASLLSAQSPHRVYISGYLPHSVVMDGASLVISHAGHGTVMKAIRHATPMVLVPWGRDQPGVASRAEALGVAAVVKRDDCCSASLAEAISHVLNDPKMPCQLTSAAKRLRQVDGVQNGCSIIERFFR